jgi:carbamate kinase
MAASVVPAPPLDVLGAETQGQIGYLLAQALNDAFLERGRHRREIAVIVTRTVVPADDPAFTNPTKPVGPIYDEATAREHAAARGWSVAPDGKNWRRVVPSPPPIRIVEAAAIRSLVDAGVLVVASGGGGVPVVELPDGRISRASRRSSTRTWRRWCWPGPWTRTGWCCSATSTRSIGAGARRARSRSCG